MVLRIFGFSIAVTVLSLLAGFLYGGPQALVLVLILGILEVSLSFDNAVINYWTADAVAVTGHRPPADPRGSEHGMRGPPQNECPHEYHQRYPPPEQQ